MKKPVFALLCLCCTSAFAQGNSGDSLSIALEMQGSFSNSKTPLWLNANKYGLSSLTASNGYVRGIATYNKDFLDGVALLEELLAFGACQAALCGATGGKECQPRQGSNPNCSYYFFHFVRCYNGAKIQKNNKNYQQFINICC